MFSRNNGSHLFSLLVVIVLPFLLLGHAMEESDSNDLHNMVESRTESLLYTSYIHESDSLTKLYLHEKDPALNLLGNSFAEIKEVMGDPDQQGYSSWNGPHNYMLYNHKDGTIIFCSPVDMDTKIAVSMFLGEGQEILGAEIGMTFEEIKDVLGTPDFGPESGMDDLYYLEYHFEEKIDELPEVFISFSADAIDGETRDVFIKWEAFEYKQEKTWEPLMTKVTSF